MNQTVGPRCPLPVCSREYTSAVEAKQVAQQDAERAKFIVSARRCCARPLPRPEPTQVHMGRCLAHERIMQGLGRASQPPSTSPHCLLLRRSGSCRSELHPPPCRSELLTPCLLGAPPPPPLCCCAGGEGGAGEAVGHHPRAG